MGDEGHFYEIRFRLRRQLSHLHWTLGKPFTPSQEEAWSLLNEVEKIIKILVQMEKCLAPDDKSELAYQVRHTLAMHQPAWKQDDKPGYPSADDPPKPLWHYPETLRR